MRARNIRSLYSTIIYKSFVVFATTDNKNRVKVRIIFEVVSVYTAVQKMCDEGSATNINRKDPKFGTKLVHAGHDPAEWTYKDVVPPIAMSTIFNSSSPGVIEVKYCVIIFTYNSFREDLPFSRP